MQSTKGLSVSIVLIFFFFWNASIHLASVQAFHGNAGRLHLHVAQHTNLRTLFADYPFVKNFFKHLLQNDGRSLSHNDSKAIAKTDIVGKETTTSSLTTSRNVTTTSTFIAPSTTTFSQTTTPRAYHCYSPDISSDGACRLKNDITWVDASSHCGCKQELKLNATFPEENFQVFLENNENAWRIQQFYEVVDNHTITATLNASLPGKYNLLCFSNSSETPALLCSRRVTIGYAPLDVENLICVSWNWNILQCNWTLPDNPAQQPSEDYKVYLKTSTSEIPCDHKPEGCLENCCEWTVPYYQPADRLFIISFSVKNQLGSASFNHTFDNWETIIPDPVVNLALKTTNGSLGVDVQWKMPVYMGTLASQYGILSAVEYRPMYGNDTWLLGKYFICRAGLCNATINVEHPGANYEVRVRIRARRTNFTLEDDGWWSKWTPQRVRIPPQRPWNPPTLGVGTFQSSKGSEIGLRDISITWRPLPDFEHNGDNLIYLVNATVNGQTFPNASISGTFVSYKGIYDDSVVRVEVTAANIVGPCNHSSVIEIFPTQTLPPLPVMPVVVFHPSTQQYELRWGNVDNTTHDFTVYVCTDGLDSKEPCQNNLYWLSTGNTSSANVTLQDFGLSGLSNKEIRFALSSETASGGISSGMSWDGCLSPQNYRTTSSPPVIGNSILTNTTSATLAWTLSCENRAAVVEAVIVEWCPGSHNFSTPCESPETRITSDVFSGQIVLPELRADTQYSARLRLQYRENLSIWSEPRVFSTSKVNDPGMAGWLIFIISLACIITMVILVLLSTYAKGKIKSMLQDLNTPINVPLGMAYEDGSRRNSQGSSRDLPALHTRNYTSERFPSEEDIPKETKIPNAQRSFIRTPSIDASAKQVNGGRSLEGEYLPGSSEEAENLLQQTSSEETSKGSSSPNSPRQLLSDSPYVQASFPFDNVQSLDTADKSALVPQSSSLPSRGYVSIQHPEQPMTPESGYVLYHCPVDTLSGVSEAKHNSHEHSAYMPLSFNHLGRPLPNAESGYISSEWINKSFSENEPESKNTNDTQVPRATLPGNSVYVQLHQSAGDHFSHSQKQATNAVTDSGSPSLPEESSNLRPPEKSAYVQAVFPFDKIIAVTPTNDSASTLEPSHSQSEEYMALQHAEGAKKPSNEYIQQHYSDLEGTEVSSSNKEKYVDMHEFSINGPFFNEHNAVSLPDEETGKASHYTTVSSTAPPNDNSYVKLEQLTGDQSPPKELTNNDIEERLYTGKLLAVGNEALLSPRMSDNGLEMMENSEASKKQVFKANDNGYVENLVPRNEDKANPNETIPTQERDEMASIHKEPACGYMSVESFRDSRRPVEGEDDFNFNSCDKVDIANKSSLNGGAVYENLENPVALKIDPSRFLIDLSRTNPFIYDEEAASDSQPSLTFVLDEFKGKDGYVSLNGEVDEAPVTGSPDSGICNTDDNLSSLGAFQRATAGKVSQYDNSGSEESREMHTFKTGSIMATDLSPGYCRVSDVQE